MLRSETDVPSRTSTFTKTNANQFGSLEVGEVCDQRGNPAPGLALSAFLKVPWFKLEA